MDNLPNTQAQSSEIPSGVIQHNLSNIEPTSSELDDLWKMYFTEGWQQQC